MLRDEGVAVESVWAGTSAGVRDSDVRGGAAESYRDIDHQLRCIAKRKAGLEIEEARWLREAERQRIWRKLGFSTALEYLEDVFGYSPRTAMDRLRVARELAGLPKLEAAVSAGELPYSAARELTRVMTPGTEKAWLARAQGKNLRDIEELVVGRRKGDDPDAPRNPDLIKRRRVMELSPRVDALFERSRAVLADELGSHLDDELLLETLCRCFLGHGHEIAVGVMPASGTELADPAVERTPGDGTVVADAAVKQTPGAGTAPGAEASATRARARAPRPAHRIVTFKCDECSRVFQQGKGRLVQLSTDELSLIECDAEVVHMDAASQRPTLTIPQRIRNQVWTRDQGRCRVPGCRATRYLDIHHIVHRSDGGDHDPGNMTVLCSGHHKLHHDGLLEITGRAPDQLEFVRDGKRLVDARSPSESLTAEELRESTTSNKLAQVVKLEEAKQTLVKLGFTRRDARQALERASAHVGSDADVPALVRAVLADTRSAAVPADENPLKLARQALVQLGFPLAIAARAVDEASAHVGNVELSTLIKEALRNCR